MKGMNNWSGLQERWCSMLSNSQLQFCLFILVGALNTVFGYAIFSLFIFLKIHYVMATLFSTIAGVIFNFFTTGFIVFQNKKIKLFIKFFLAYLALYLINISIIYALKSHNINTYLSGAVSIGSLSFISFIVSKYYVFKERE